MIESNQLNKYRLYWSCPPDHAKVRPWVAQQMYLDGYTKGVFDLTIIAFDKDIVKVWLIEFKYGKNGYTKEQKAIADKCEDTPVTALKIRSLDEFIEFLEELK